jgi:hypothetical protein
MMLVINYTLLEELVNRHIEDKLPIIIEDNFISPEFTKELNSSISQLEKGNR